MPDRIEHLQRLLRERIVILDGAMGTMIQQHKLDEAAFRGERFADWRGKDLKGPERPAQPHPTRSHRGNSPAISRSRRGHHRDQHVQFAAPFRWRITGWKRWLTSCPRPARNAPAARRMRSKRRSPGRVCFVAGAIGPTTKTSSISTDVNNPGARGMQLR